MAEFDVVIDTSVFDRRLSKLEREQLPFARVLAANQAAFETRSTLQQSMRLFLDQPIPLTIRGVRYEKATKERPASALGISDDGAKGTSPRQYLQALIRGRRRRQKRSERVLARAGIIGGDEGWVPVPSALKLNRYGNVTGARMTQILSGIGAFGEEGFSANITSASRARGTKRGRREYFVARGSDHLRRGIYERQGSRRKAKHKYRGLAAGRQKRARNIRPILLFADLPTYGVLFDFYRIAQEEGRRRFLAAWPAALRRALATARRR